MQRTFFAALGVATFLAIGAIGCASETEPTDAPNEETGEDDLTNRQLPGVVAIEIAEVTMPSTVTSTKMIGAPKKVKSVLTGVKKLRPTDPVPRCLMRETTRLTFFDGAGKKLATVGSYCGGFGHITFENGNEGYGVRFSGEVVENAKSAPFAVGDALWGITKIDISKPGRDEKRSVEGAAMKPILDGIDLDAVPDPNASFPRCLPSHAVSFLRADKSVATTSFLCGSGTPPASVKAPFVALDPANPNATLARGGITLDPRPVVAALAKPR